MGWAVFLPLLSPKHSHTLCLSLPHLSSPLPASESLPLHPSSSLTVPFLFLFLLTSCVRLPFLLLTLSLIHALSVPSFPAFYLSLLYPIPSLSLPLSLPLSSYLTYLPFLSIPLLHFNSFCVIFSFSMCLPSPLLLPLSPPLYSTWRSPAARRGPAWRPAHSSS